MSEVPSVKLNTGDEIPQIGLGTWLIKNEKECINAINTALEAGYRHIDTAQIYENEQHIGKAVKNSNVPRKEIFITTKIWGDNFWWDDLIPSFNESLEKLQTDYVDLLLLHFPQTETRGPAWRRMEELYKSGRAKNIGVSNYNVKHLKELFSQTNIKPTVNQVEIHIFLQQPELIKFCKQNDIVVEAYSPLAHGYGLKTSVLGDVAKKYGKSPAQIMIRWCIEQGHVVLPKSSNPERIKENIDVYDFKLDQTDLSKLRQLDENFRTCWDPTNIP